MFSEEAIKVDRISKQYLLYESPEDRLKQMIVPKIQKIFGRRSTPYYRVFPAVSDVSFSIRKGETLGIVGRNGSGKSTLLQMICGTLRPTSGSIRVSGRIAALLELGSGFNPEFTGRENVYLNASILGLSREETEHRFEDILEFSGIGEFIDQPVKTYSSGMYVRLAFAVATNVDPDILVVDEALSVGDEAFQRKCFTRIEQIKDRGGTILFVSHGAQTIVQLCDRALLIDQGQRLLLSSPSLVVKQYQRLVNLTGDAANIVRKEIRLIDSIEDSAACPDFETSAQNSKPELGHGNPVAKTEIDESIAATDAAWLDENLISETRVEYNAKGATISDARIETLTGAPVNNIQFGKRYRVRYSAYIDKPSTGLVFGTQFKTLEGFVLAGINNDATRKVPKIDTDSTRLFDVTFEFECNLLPGPYAVDVGIMGEDGFAHRVLDALLFRVMEQEDLLSVGFLDLKPSMHIEGI